jgi:hypothetical protein
MTWCTLSQTEYPVSNAGCGEASCLSTSEVSDPAHLLGMHRETLAPLTAAHILHAILHDACSKILCLKLVNIRLSNAAALLIHISQFLAPSESKTASAHSFHAAFPKPPKPLIHILPPKSAISSLRTSIPTSERDQDHNIPFLAP